MVGRSAGSVKSGPLIQNQRRNLCGRRAVMAPSYEEGSMLNDLAKILMVVSSALLGSTAMFAWLWARARERALRAELERRPQLDPMVDLQALAHTVDAMAIE